MPCTPRVPSSSPSAGLRAVLIERTTRCNGSLRTDTAVTAHLRVIVARVLRTGRGPTALVGWVRRQMTDQPLPAGDPAGHLAARLLAGLLPASASHTRVGR